MCNICLYLISQQCAASYTIPFDAQRNSLWKMEYSMDGLESFTVQAIEQRIIILCLKNGFSHKKDKIKKITIYCQLSQDRGLMRNGPQRGKVDS